MTWVAAKPPELPSALSGAISTVSSSYVCFFIFNMRENLYGGSDGKESACHAGALGSIPGSGRSPGKGDIYMLLLLLSHFSCVRLCVTP